MSFLFSHLYSTMKSHFINSAFVKAFCSDESFEDSFKQTLKSYNDYKNVLNQISERNSTLRKDEEILYITPESSIISSPISQIKICVKDEVRPNIARFLNLNEYFIDLVSKYEYDINSEKLIKWFKQYKNKKCVLEYKTSIVNIIKDYLAVCEGSYIQDKKVIIVVILFEILTTKLGDDLIETHDKFKNTVHNKIYEMKRESHLEFREHFKKFETGKKYILIEKNRKYRKTLLKNYLVGSCKFISLYKRVKYQKHKRDKQVRTIVFYISSTHLLILFFILVRFFYFI
jgi:hypothetical protein